MAQGILQKVTANTLDLEVAIGGAAYESGVETKVVLVVFHPDMKVYELVQQAGAMPELKELTLSDLQEGAIRF